VGKKSIKHPASKEFVWSVTRREPGRAYMVCRLKSRKDPEAVFRLKNPYNASRRIGRRGIGFFTEPDKQRILRQEPADFDKFWLDRKAELAKVPLKVLEKVPYSQKDLPNKDYEVYDLKIACAGSAPVSGIITIPKDKSRKYPAIVQYHGAGVRSATAAVKAGYIVFDVNAHGIPNGKPQKYYADITADKTRNPYKQSAAKRSEMFCYMFLRAVRALEYIRTLPEWNGKDLIVTGASQGGVQSLAAAALDKNVTLALPSVPAMVGCAEFTIRKGVESAWPNPYRTAYYQKKDITGIAKKFDYVDGAFLMRRISCPIHISVGLFDTHAAHVFAAFNDCPAKVKTITGVPDMGHYNYNPKGNELLNK
jgi:cephalosporin-C deacetylase-like acetyl esterase